MKIASFTLNTSSPGGIEKICVLLAEHWADRGHTSDIINFFSDNHSFFPISNKVSVYNLDVKKRSSGLVSFLIANLRRIIRLRRLLKAIDYDIVVCHGPVPLIIAGLASLCTRIRIISYPHVVVDQKRNIIVKAIQYVGFLFSNHIVLQTISDQIYIPSILSKRISIIPNLSEVSAGDSLQAGRDKIILSVGNISPQKNYPLLIHAYALSGIARLGWQLKIAGGGYDADVMKLKDVAKSCGVENNVCFLGPVSDVKPLYNEASLFVNSSNVEGMSVATMQALLHGIPVIATNCSNGQRALIQDNENGYLIDVDDTQQMSQVIKKLAENDTLRLKMSKAALKSSTAFSPMRVYELWDTLIETSLRR